MNNVSIIHDALSTSSTRIRGTRRVWDRLRRRMTGRSKLRTENQTKRTGPRSRTEGMSPHRAHGRERALWLSYHSVLCAWCAQLLRRVSSSIIARAARTYRSTCSRGYAIAFHILNSRRSTFSAISATVLKLLLLYNITRQ